MFRPIAASTALTSVGNGLFIAVSFLYGTRVLDVPAPVMAGALTAAGLLSIAVTVPTGRLIEGREPGAVNAVALVVQGVAVAAFAAAGPVVPLLLAVAAVTIAGKVKLAARGALIGRAFTGPERTRMRARLRGLTNGGIGVGSLLAAAATAADTHAAYVAALAAVAALYVAGAVPLWWAGRRRPLVPPSVAGDAVPRPAAVRDRRYVSVAAINGLLGLHYLLLEVGMPLWVASGAHRAVWLVSIGLLVNTVVVALGQVPLSRFVEGVPRAAVATAASGVLFAAACAAIAGAGLAAAATVAIVLAAFLVYSVGEVLQAAAAWELSYELADPQRPAEYQAVFGSGLTLGTVIAPVAITGAILVAGDAGWLLLGGLLLAAGGLHLPLAARRAD